MNTFATIIELYTFKRVTFYSILVEGQSLPMGMEYLQTHGKHRHFQVLMTWIKRIGNDYTAAQHYFRRERAAAALPPPIDITHEACSLRWYCVRLSPSAVVLLHGGDKTTQRAQECPNVSIHFHNANAISEAIWAAYDEGEISLGSDDRLLVPDNHRLQIENLNLEY